ncbi:TfdA family taurine catabolism dioxygenase TauD [Cupriavidus metallidurans]
MHALKETDVVGSEDLPIFENAQSWRGPELVHRNDWIHEFSADEISEIDAAVSHLDAKGVDILTIDRSMFSLPSLSAVLTSAKHEILHGRGFQLFRGVPVERYTPRQSAIAYWGLGQHLGEALSQNGKGHVLGHVANLGLNYADPEVRGYQTNARLPYHSDLADMVGLLCLRASKSGGLSSIVSSTTLWNEMVRRRPDHARTLLEPFYYTRWGEIPEGKLAFEAIPVFAPWHGSMIANYVRSAILKAQSLPGVPPLTLRQVEAMDFLDSLCVDPELHLDMAFKPGDVQLLSNHFILHSRTAYEDWAEVEKRRHLLRLWLACPDGPALPPFMYERFGTTSSGRPDGIRVPGVELVAPVEVV